MRKSAKLKMRREKCRFNQAVRLYASILPIGVVTTGNHYTIAGAMSSVLVMNAEIKLQSSPEFGSPPCRVLSLIASAVMLTFAEGECAKTMVWVAVRSSGLGPVSTCRSNSISF